MISVFVLFIAKTFDMFGVSCGGYKKMTLSGFATHDALHSRLFLLTFKRPPGVKFDPSLRFFFDNFFYVRVSYNDTNLRDFVTTSFL